VIQVEGNAPLEEKENAKQIKAKLLEVFKDVKEKDINVGANYGVGDKMGVIAEANSVYVNEEKKEGLVEVKH